MASAPSKYHRIIPRDNQGFSDVYAILAAFPTGSAAVDHAIKKLLAAGQRGHKDRLTDLKEAAWSIQRAIELESES